jgi:hypothetical protein
MYCLYVVLNQTIFFSLPRENRFLSWKNTTKKKVVEENTNYLYLEEEMEERNKMEKIWAYL